MDEHTVIVLGLPHTCNPKKVKLYFESECGVKIEDIKVSRTSAEVKLAGETDCKTFCDKLPHKIKFGNYDHVLSISKRIEPASSELQITGRNYDLHQSSAKSTFSQPQTWSKLTLLPNCKRGLLVQPTSERTTPGEVRKYFEKNVPSCGGPIKEIIPMIDGIFVIFMDETVAEKVWSSRPHRITGKAVRVYLKDVPPRYPRELVVKPKGMKLDQENLELLLKKCSKKAMPIKKITLTVGGSFFIIYEDSVVEEDVQILVGKFRKRSPGIDISFLPKTDCIYVENLPKDFSDHEIRILFENSARSGGGPVTRIDHIEKGCLLIHFSSYKDAGAVFDKSRNRKLSVFGNILTIHLYFHGIHEKKLEKPNELDELILPWLDVKAVKVPSGNDHQDAATISPQNGTTTYRNISPELIEFFSMKSEHLAFLKSRLSAQTNVQMSFEGFELSFESENEGVQKAAMKDIEKFLEDYTCRHVTSKSTLPIIDMDLSSGDSKLDVHLRCREDGSFIVAGLKTEVDSYIRHLENVSNVHCLDLGRNLIRWFVETGALKQLRKDHEVIYGNSYDRVLLVGDHLKVAEAKQAVEHLVKKLQTEKYVPHESGIAAFLNNGATSEKILANVSELMKSSQIPAILVLRGDSAHILGPIGCIRNAASLLDKDLTADKSFLNGTAGLDQSKLPDSWTKIMNFQSDGRIKMTLIMENTILLAGFRDFIHQAKEELEQCQDTNWKLVKMEQGAAKHISDFMQLAELCKTNNVLYHSNADGIGLCGKKENVEEVSERLQMWHRDVTKEFACIKIPGAAEFLKTSDGMKLLKRAGESFNSTILIVSKLQNDDQSKKDTVAQLQKSSSPLFMRMGPLMVQIKQGDITDETNEVIVSSIGKNFNMSRGALSRAIAKRGGPSIESGLKRKKQKICITTGGDLRCKNIIHVVLQEETETLKDDLVSILRKAEGLKLKSISIPPIGTGAGGIPNRVVAQLMFESIKKFVKTPSEVKNLKVLDIVLFDETQMDDFKEIFSILSEASGVKPTGESLRKVVVTQIKSIFSTETVQPKCQKFGSLTVSVQQGDITDAVTDAIVNSTNSDFDLDRGMVSKAIIRKGGYKIQEAVYKAQGSTIRVTIGGNLRCKWIIHVNTLRNMVKIGQCVIEVLKLAEEYHCVSISIPAIGTGNLQLSVSNVAKTMRDAVLEFERQNPNLKYLSKVDFVIHEKQQMGQFHDAFFKSAFTPGELSVINKLEENIVLEAFSSESNSARKALTYIKDKVKENIQRA